MSWASSGWARGAFAGRTSTAGPPGQHTLPPPIPGGTASWSFETSRTLAYGLRGWAGRVSPNSYPGGGISIRPVPELGVMQITAWWPDADALALVRVEGDGTFVPVRGGSPVAIPGPTRRNYCQNPSFEAGLNGTAPEAGSPTLTNPSDGTAARGSAYLTATIASAGACGVVVPNAVTAGLDLTVAFDLRLSAVASAVTVTATWLDSGGTPLVSSVSALTAADINRSVTTWGRQVLQMTTPAAGVSATVKVVASGMPAGGTMSLDGVVIERGTTDGSYFDGATYGATWLGVTDLSASALAPLSMVDDGECPFDVPVRYKLVKAARLGGTMTSEAAVLPSTGDVWLTHPNQPAEPVKVLIEKRPLRGKESGQGIFQAIGATKATTVAPRRRSGWRGTEDINFWTLDEASTDELWSLFDDNQPMLLRAPLELGYGTGTWMSIGDVGEDPDGSGTYQHYLKLSGSWLEVDAPAV